MSDIKKLYSWDFPNTKLKPDGYDMTGVPELTEDNFHILIEEYNRLVEAVQELIEAKQ